MTRKEAERQTRQADTLRALGFTQDEAEALRRISMTLHRWHEMECGDGNGMIERDEKTGKPLWRFRYSTQFGHVNHALTIADREKGALKRLGKIIAERNARMPVAEIVAPYVQTDPRGAALYIIRPGDVPQGADVSAYYTRGICVY